MDPVQAVFNPVEFLNSLNLAGFPSHDLEVKSLCSNHVALKSGSSKTVQWSRLPCPKSLFGDSLSHQGISLTRNILAASPYPAAYSRFDNPWLDSQNHTLLSYSSTCAEATAATVASVASINSGTSISGPHQHHQPYQYHYGHHQNELLTGSNPALPTTFDMRQAQDSAKAAAVAAAAVAAAVRYPTYWHATASTIGSGPQEYHPSGVGTPPSSSTSGTIAISGIDQVPPLW